MDQWNRMGILADTTAGADAARILWDAWLQATRIESLPEHCRPRNRAEGYAIQFELVRLSGQQVAGWKIAASSLAGQRHLNVDGPLAGPLLANRLAGTGSTFDLCGNRMRLAEAEFAFRMAAPLPPRASPYTVDEVRAATASLHPAIELPDSRYEDVTVVGIRWGLVGSQLGLRGDQGGGMNAAGGVSSHGLVRAVVDGMTRERRIPQGRDLA